MSERSSTRRVKVMPGYPSYLRDGQRDSTTPEDIIAHYASEMQSGFDRAATIDLEPLTASEEVTLRELRTYAWRCFSESFRQVYEDEKLRDFCKFYLQVVASFVRDNLINQTFPSCGAVLGVIHRNWDDHYRNTPTDAQFTGDYRKMEFHVIRNDKDDEWGQLFFGLTPVAVLRFIEMQNPDDE